MQNLNWKKIIIIVGFVAITIAIGFTLYYLFFKSTPTTEPTEQIPGELTELPISPTGQIIPTELPTGQTPQAGEITLVPKAYVEEGEKISNVASGGLTVVNDLDYNQTEFTSINSDGQGVLGYNQQTGNFYQIDKTGNKQLLSEKTFQDVTDVAWAPNSQKAIMEFPDGSNILYDFSTGKQITLPTNWTEFEFNETESKIAFKDMDNDPDKRFLATANPDGSNQNYLEFLGTKADKVEVNWSSNNQIVGYYQESSSSSYTKLYFIGQNNENFRLLEVNGQNIELEFTPDGKKAIYSANNSFTDHKPVLNIVNTSGENIGNDHYSLEINTWAHKCTFENENTMYCAVPKEMPENAGWFPQLADNIGDYIYKINLQTGSKAFIAEPEFEYAIESMTVSEDGSTLFFTDVNTQTLHQIQLK